MNAHPALLIIDVQRAIDDPSWGSRNNPDAEQRMQSLLHHWRERAWPVVHIRHLSRDAKSTYRPGQAGCEFKAQVQPHSGEVVITKQTNNAFVGTELDGLLKSRQIDTLVICGVITNNSVEATARMAGNLGYRTYVVEDATATFDKRDFRGNPRSADEVHAMSLANLDGEYARVVSSAEVFVSVEAKAIPTDCNSLEVVRANIDAIDRRIVALLAERGQYVWQAARFKHTEGEVRAPDRVEQVIVKVRSLAQDLGANPLVTERVYRTMIDEFISAELEQHSKL